MHPLHCSQGNLDMQLKRSALASLPMYAPRVAQAMKGAGVAFAADGTLSSLGGQDMSQRGRKCSTYAPGGRACLVTCAALVLAARLFLHAALAVAQGPLPRRPGIQCAGSAWCQPLLPGLV